MIVLIFVCMFTFWIFLPHMRENIWFCLSEPGLLHLIWCPPIDLFTFKPHDIIPYNWVILHCVYIYHIFLIHSSVVWHLGCFHSSVIVNSAAVNIRVPVSLLYLDLRSFGNMPRSKYPLFKIWILYQKPILRFERLHFQRKMPL
jgi:hypothetical protein